MSKGRYHCVKCKGVDWNRVVGQVAGRCLVFAVDVAKHDFVACLRLKGGEILLRVKWTHPAETPAVLAGVAQLVAAGPVEAALEASGTYGDALRFHLRERGAAVYRVSPKRVHDEAEVIDGVPSLHDAKAADLIADLHGRGLSRVWEEPDAQRRELHAQLKMLQQCKARYHQECNRLEALLSRHWPELLTLLDLDSATLAALIADFGKPEMVAGLGESARQLMKQVGRALLAPEKIEAVLASAGVTLGVPCVAAEQTLLRWQATQVMDSGKELRRIEKLIEAAVAHDPDLAAVAAVVGGVTSAVLLASQGSPRSYPSAAAYCKGYGLNLKERSSGKYQGQLKITKRGPAIARFYLYFAALRLIGQQPVVARWFEAKTARAGACKGKQVIELMRKLAKALWHQAHGQPFTVERLFSARVGA
jgi:transposase